MDQFLSASFFPHKLLVLQWTFAIQNASEAAVQVWLGGKFCGWVFACPSLRLRLFVSRGRFVRYSINLINSLLPARLDLVYTILLLILEHFHQRGKVGLIKRCSFLHTGTPRRLIIATVVELPGMYFSFLAF